MEKGFITVNKLPAPTWEKLKVNRADVSLAGISAKAGAVTVRGTAPAETADENIIKDFSAVKTGMGEEISDFFDDLHKDKNFKPDFLKASGNTLLKFEDSNEPKAERLFLDVAENEKATVIMSVLCSGVFQTIANLKKGARLELVQIINESGKDTVLTDIGAVCEEGAGFKLIQVFMSGKEVYSGCRTLLSGKDSRYEAYLGYDLSGEDILDMNYHAVHTGKRTESAITASGALAGSSQKVFRGTIDFIRGCAGAVGNENEDVLILDDGVINKTVPLILCEEEDVEGNHGASIGKPDDETLFYLMSRGISREEALAVLRRSKLCGAVMKISNEEFRKELLESIYDRT